MNVVKKKHHHLETNLSREYRYKCILSIYVPFIISSFHNLIIIIAGPLKYGRRDPFFSTNIIQRIFPFDPHYSMDHFPSTIVRCCRDSFNFNHQYRKDPFLSIIVVFVEILSISTIIIGKIIFLQLSLL